MNPNDIISSLTSKIANSQSRWMDEQCFKYIPKWQRYAMDKFKWNWLRNLFGWGFEIKRSVGADIVDENDGSPVYVKTVFFKHHEKTISSADFIISRGVTNDQIKTGDSQA